jgi:NAD(P)-dependent dehydrogenase (short-subunit alcohol dehydrogenase family)
VDTLERKVALVTGAGSGLGEAIALTLARAGATTIVADVRAREAQRVAACAAQHAEAVPLRLDVSDEQSARDAIAAVLGRYGRIDALINNAGVDVTLPIDELSVCDWDRVIAVNLRGPFLMSKEAMTAMRAQGAGHIVNIVSTAAKRTWANASAYHASKWGLLGFSHALHVEARAGNVKVTAVVAGGMRTPFILERFPDTDPGVLQDPSSVAETVRFVLTQPDETVIPEVMVLPMRETSWP